MHDLYIKTYGFICNTNWESFQISALPDKFVEYEHTHKNISMAKFKGQMRGSNGTAKIHVSGCCKDLSAQFWYTA
jgi:hypothetical protein